MNINGLKLYKAQGLQIINKIRDFSIHSGSNHKTEEHESFHEKNLHHHYLMIHTIHLKTT